MTDLRNKYSPHRPFLSMCRSARLYHCCRCHAQVIICSTCDRGQRYCTQGCAALARLASQRSAGKKYQSSRVGRFHNAARQKRFRDRHKQKVTHQGSPRLASHDVLKRKRDGLERAENIDSVDGDLHCHRCGAVCIPFLRRDFIHASRTLPVFRNR